MNRITLALAAAIAVCCGGSAENGNGIAAEWRLTEPRVAIGVIDGDANYQFEFLSSAWKTDDGKIIVADRGQTSLMFYDEHGAFLRRIGRQGAGPGEMRYMGYAFPYRGDSVAVHDLGGRSISIFDGDGNFARQLMVRVTYVRKPGMSPSQSCCQVMAAFADGSFLVHPPDDIPNEPGPDRYSTLSLLRISADGEGPDTIGTFESRPYRHDASRPNAIRSLATAMPFLYDAGDDRIYGGNARDNVLVMVRIDGSPPDSIRIGPEPPPITESMIDERERLLREDFERRPAFYEGGLQNLSDDAYPERQPAFNRVFVDRVGRIWIGDWTLHESAYQSLPEGKRYRIHDSDGMLIATITLPPESRIMWADADEVLLIERDSLDVQYVRIYGLVGERT
jgi:hypothetical protein